MSQPARHLRAPAPRREEATGSHAVVREQGTARGRRTALVAAGGLALAVLFSLVYLNVVMAQRQIELNQLNAQETAAQANYQNLRLKVAELESPQHIISTAEGQLHMQQPASVTYVSPPPGATVSGSGGAPAVTTHPGTVTAPQGDADWPSIKADLAGAP